MNRIFRSIFKLDINHSFYKDNISTDIDFDLDLKSQQIAKNYRLLFKNKQGSCQLIMECNKNDDQIKPFIAIDKPLKIKIQLKLTNKHFFNFTDIEFLNLKQKFLYFSNKDTDNLHQAKNALISVAYSDLKINFSETIDSFRVTDIEGNDVTQNLPSPKIEEETISINTGSLEYGYYNLYINDLNPIQFYRSPSLENPVLGIFEFIILPEKVDEYLKSPQTHSLLFDNRKTFWKYVIQMKYNDLDNLEIIDESHEVEFRETVGAVANPKRKEFISDRKIGIQETYNMKFSLIKNNPTQNVNKVLIEKLNFPETHSIQPFEKGTTNYLSTTYILI